MATAPATFEGQVADSVLAAVKANSATIIAAITSVEGGVESLIATELGKISVSNPIEQALFSAVKPIVIAELTALEAQESGAVIYTWALAQAQKWATELGG